MIHATRAIVVVSTALAAFAEGALATPYFPPSTIWLATGLAIGLAVFGERVRAFVLPLVLAVMYVLPAMMIASGSNENFSIEYVWMLPLLGLSMAGRGA